MKEIDVETWYRKDVFRYFGTFDDPYFSITADVDVTAVHSLSKDEGLSLNLSILHLALSAANRIPEFRTRVVGDKVVEYDVVHGSQIVLHDDESFSFCLHETRPSLRDFCSEGTEVIRKARESRVLDEHSERVDQIFFSVIPWVAFTSFKNAQKKDHTQTVPRIVFGKIGGGDGRRMMPVSVEVHHAMVDGLHVGRFFENFQEALSNPS